ncbi:MFS transporter [Wenzhouxiangella marina]|uniref:Major facilitator superfamily MFS_1 n=1 Tax=Wenzhouxiangella marina TaxID=1579979 RepID=A0A0K0XSH7_9GAMM|nr:MFS transporter [Wenzhouxiangella marina]AKS40638.1 Major facilitator superfamily MFS_1 [Wenzhouxiangella marina]MBB6088407.1 MFS family permease [Wenzhouxiangella marina]
MRGIFAIITLLLGIAILLAGNGLVGTLLGVRGGMEGFSSGVLGVIMAGYFSGFVAGTFIVPRIIRSAGHVRCFAALASICSVTVLVHGLFIHPLVWLVARAIAGICIVGIYIVIESWLNEQTSNEQRGHIFSAYMTTTLIGLGLGQTLLLAGDISTLELFALGSVLMSIGLVPVALTRVKEPPLVDTHRLGLGQLYRISPLGVIGALFAGVGTGAFWGLAPVMASGLGLDARGVAGFMSLSILGGILMMWPLGRLSDRFDRRSVLAIVSLITALAALAGWWLLDIRLQLIMLTGFVYGAFGFSTYALAASHTNDHVDSQHMLEAASSLQLLYGAGAIIGPLLAGSLMQWSGPATLLPFMSAAALVPALFALWRMRIRPALPTEQQSEWVPQFATSPAVLEMHPDSVEGPESPPEGDTMTDDRVSGSDQERAADGNTS